MARMPDPWSEEMDAQLLHLRNIEKKSWFQIGPFVGKSKTSVRHRYMRLTDPALRIRFSNRKSWSDESEAQIFHLRHVEMKTVAEIVEITGRTYSSVHSKLTDMKRGKARTKEVFVPQNVVPPQVMVDRDRRMAGARDLTADFFGDPRPGQSALDRREVCCEQD